MIEVKTFAFEVNNSAVREVALSKPVPVVSQFMSEAGCEVFFHFMQVHTVLGSLWACKSRKDVVKVEFKHISVGLFLSPIFIPETLSFGVGFNACDSSIFTAGQSKIVECSFINGEKAAGRTVFWSHVGNGRAVSKREGFHTRTEEFNEFSNNTVFS